MPELVALRAQVLPVGFVGRDLDRHALGDVQAVALQPDDLLRVVGEQPEVLHAQIHEDLGADPVVAQIGLEAERCIGLDRVLSLVLELVGAHLVEQPDAPPFLAHVNENAAPLGLDDRQRLLELEPAVAPARVEDVADQTLGVDAHENRGVPRHLPHDEGELHATVHARVVGDRDEFAPVRGELGCGDPSDQLLLADPVLDQILDGDHRESVRQGELLELGHPRHPAILVEDLADDTGRVRAREPREVHRRLGVAGAAQDAARHRPQRKDVPRAGEILGPHLRIDQGADRDRAVVGGGAGRDAASGVDRHGERSPHRRRVVRDHHRDLELVQPLAGHRHADEAAAVLGHEVDRLRRDLVGGHHEIALVLAVLVVNDHEDAPLADLLDRLLDGRKPRHVAPLSASDRTRYLPITSASTFVACPGLSRPRVVAPSVYGISITSKLMSPSPATVRLTPSTATDPWGISSGSSSRRGSPIRTRVVDSTRVTSSTVPTPSTCPRTRWPPRAPPNRSGRSRLTGSPGWSRPSVVRASVSGPSSNTKPSGGRSTTVRHAPFTATLAPTSLPSSVAPACTPSRSTAPARTSVTTVPISSTIPVNTYASRGSRITSASTRISSPTRVMARGPSLTPLFSSRPAPPTTEGAVRPPTSRGATKTATRSTTPASRKAAWTSPPPSTRTPRTSRAKSSPRRKPRSTRPSRVGHLTTVAPAASRERTRPSDTPSPTATIARAGSPAAIKRAPGGVRASVSSATRYGWHGHGSPSRTVSSGSSRSTVAIPTTMASASLRSRWA